MIFIPNKINAPKMAKPKTNFRVPMNTNCQIASCEVAITRFPFARTAAETELNLRSLAQSLEILGYGRNFNVLLLESRAPNDLNSIFGNFLPDIDSKGDTNQVSVLELDTRPFVAIIQ